MIIKYPLIQITIKQVRFFRTFLKNESREQNTNLNELVIRNFHDVRKKYSLLLFLIVLLKSISRSVFN